MKTSDAHEVIERLGLEPHPEGGWYRETLRAPGAAGGRGACTSILFLLEAGQRSDWHRIDATEIWLHQLGGPVILRVTAGEAVIEHRLGPDIAAGEVLQAAVPAGEWQAAETLDRWALVGCVVAPAFEFSSFELAPPGWKPGA